MSRILVIGEDALCCALGEQIVKEALPRWSLSKTSIDTKGVTKLVAALPRYMQQAQYVQPVLCIADTDKRCPVELLQRWLPRGPGERFIFRLAVSEAESWVLSDRSGMAKFLKIPVNTLPTNPEDLPDPKREMLRLASLSKLRQLRAEIVSATDPGRPGTGYNIHLCRFVRDGWRAARGLERSPSLAKAMERLGHFATEYSRKGTR